MLSARVYRVILSVEELMFQVVLCLRRAVWIATVSTHVR